MRLDQMPLEVQRQMLETAKTEIEFHTQFLEVWKEEIDKFDKEKKAGKTYNIPLEIMKERNGYFNDVSIDNDALIKDQTAFLKSATDSLDSQISRVTIEIRNKKNTGTKMATSSSSAGGTADREWPCSGSGSSMIFKFNSDLGIKATNVTVFLNNAQDVRNYVKQTSFPDKFMVSAADKSIIQNEISRITLLLGFRRFSQMAGRTDELKEYKEGDAIKNTIKFAHISFIDSGTYEITTSSVNRIITEKEFKMEDWIIDLDYPPDPVIINAANNRRSLATGALHTVEGWFGIENGGKKYLNFGNDIFLEYSTTADLNTFLVVSTLGSPTKKFIRKADLPSGLKGLKIAEIRLSKAEVDVIDAFLKARPATWSAFSTKPDLYQLDVGDPFKYDYNLTTTYYGSILYKYKEGTTSKVVIHVSTIDNGTGATAVASFATWITSWGADTNQTIKEKHLSKYQFDLEGQINEKAINEVPLRNDLMALKDNIPANWEKILALIPKISTRRTEYEPIRKEAEKERDRKILDVQTKIDAITDVSDKANLQLLIPLYTELESLVVDKSPVTLYKAGLQTALDAIIPPPGGSTFFETYKGDEVAKIEEFRLLAKGVWSSENTATNRIPYRADIPFFVRYTITETDLSSTDWFNFIWFIKGNQKTNQGIQFKNLADGGSYSSSSDVQWKYTLNSPDNACTVKRILDPTLLQKIKVNIETNKGLPSKKIQ